MAPGRRVSNSSVKASTSYSPLNRLSNELMNRCTCFTICKQAFMRTALLERHSTYWKQPCNQTSEIWRLQHPAQFCCGWLICTWIATCEWLYCKWSSLLLYTPINVHNLLFKLLFPFAHYLTKNYVEREILMFSCLQLSPCLSCAICIVLLPDLYLSFASISILSSFDQNIDLYSCVRL